MLALLLAALLTASADSPRDASLPASQDIRHVETTLDPDAGVWTLDVQLQADASGVAWGNINASLHTSGCTGNNDLLATIAETSTIPGSTTAHAEYWLDSIRPAESVSKTIDGDTIEVQVTDSGLVGQKAACVVANLSHSRVLDSVTLPFSSTTPAPPAPPTDQPTTLALRFADGNARLTASKSGVIRVALDPFSRAVSGTIVVKSGTKAVGTATYRAKADTPVFVPVKLSAAARKPKRLRVRITATAENLTRSTSATVVRSAK